MRFSALALLLRVILPVAGLAAGLAVAPVAGWAESGTLPMPLPPPPEPPARPPVAPPRTPAHRTTPVVHPQGPSHAQKAHGAAGSVQKPVPPTSPVEPVIAPVVPAKPAEKSADVAKPGAAGPLLPRFQSLRSDDVNLRAGPGTRYRIDWVYKRRELPMEVEREFEHWRLVRDPDGIQGWVNQATLTARRSFIVKGGDATVRSDAKDTASARAILKPGVIGRIRSCEKGSDWCYVMVAGHRGYVRRSQIWGLLPDEAVSP